MKEAVCMLHKRNIWKWKALVIILLLCIWGVTNAKMSEVKAETYGDYEYTLINNGTEAEITRYVGNGGEITISK